MDNVLEIKRRMRSIKEIRHITRAMKMVAATKLRKAQERVEASRPFARKISEVLIDIYQLSGRALHPLMEIREVKQVALVVVTSDRGLCGAYNSNVIRYTLSYINQLPPETKASIIAVGRKGSEHFRRRNYEILGNYLDVAHYPSFFTAREIAGLIMEKYMAREIDEVFIFYARFYSAHRQRPRKFRLLPIIPLESEDRRPTARVTWIFEPSPESILNHLIPRYIEAEVFRALLEADAGEKGARMTSMEAATDNANEIIDQLAQEYNRSRQNIITRELAELMGGVEALRQSDAR